MASGMKNQLGNRMKKYEQAVGSTIIQRMPAIIRVDGKAFHTWTKCLENRNKRPDQFFHNVMVLTAQEMCENIQTAVFAYTQSDEISILLRDYDNIATEQWFNGNVQKIVSIAAALATEHFNYQTSNIPAKAKALFDARVFSIPKDDVVNYFIWRQQDATRNSINFIARYYFSHKQLHGKSKEQVQDMLFSEHGINWNDYKPWEKRGSAIHPSIYGKHYQPNHTEYSKWVEDLNTPLFTADRVYLNDFLEPITKE